MSDVYIVGIDMIKFGRFPEQSRRRSSAPRRRCCALDDAGLTIQDMEALYCGNLHAGERRWSASASSSEIGQTGIPVTNCANACATGATAFREAWMAIKAGVYDLVLAVGVEQMGKAGLLGGGGRRRRHPEGRPARLRPDARRLRRGRAWSTRASTAPPSSSSPRCR